MPRTEPSPTADAPTSDPYAWNPNPTVLVSRRRRVFQYPASLIHAAHTDADLERLRGEATTSALRQEKTLGIWMGVTFLGEWTSSWHYLRSALQGAPRRDDPPPESARVLCWPATHDGDPLLRAHRANLDTSSSPPRLYPHAVKGFLSRVLAYLRAVSPGDEDLWSAADGYDAPELQVLPLADVLTHSTEAGNHAYTTLLNSIRHYRRDARECVTPLGALHDYAVRYPSARQVVDECRKKAAHWRLGGA